MNKTTRCCRFLACTRARTRARTIGISHFRNIVFILLLVIVFSAFPLSSYGALRVQQCNTYTFQNQGIPKTFQEYYEIAGGSFNSNLSRKCVNRQQYCFEGTFGIASNDSNLSPSTNWTTMAGCAPHGFCAKAFFLQNFLAHECAKKPRNITITTHREAKLFGVSQGDTIVFRNLCCCIKPNCNVGAKYGPYVFLKVFGYFMACLFGIWVVFVFFTSGQQQVLTEEVLGPEGVEKLKIVGIIDEEVKLEIEQKQYKTDEERNLQVDAEGGEGFIGGVPIDIVMAVYKSHNRVGSSESELVHRWVGGSVSNVGLL